MQKNGAKIFHAPVRTSLDGLHDAFWSGVGRFARAPRADVVANLPGLRGGVVDADVCLVTNCTFP
jgi:hypothetical protein